MDRKKLFEEIAKKYLELAKEIDFKKDNKELKNMKNGVYTLWDKDEALLYVGMVSNKLTASLYRRLYGNGNAAHAKAKSWFSKVNKLKFYNQKVLNISQLRVLERILIVNKQPLYNDLEFANNQIRELLELMSGN